MKPKIGEIISFTEKGLTGRVNIKSGVVDYIPEPPNKSMLVILPTGEERIIFPEQIKGLWTPTKYHQCIRTELRGKKFLNQKVARKAFRTAVKKCVKTINKTRR